ncbi:MAG: hypothetical protein ACFFBH_12665 [Promethearchaeota archaeon]
MGSGIRVKQRYRNPSTKTKQRKPEYIRSPSIPIKILLAHDNRIDYHTQKAHRLAKWMDQKKEFEVLYDKKFWKKGEITSVTETNRREQEMVQKADVLVRLIHPSSKTGEKRHEGAKREFRKAMRVGKPVIEIYYMDARTSSTRRVQETHYKNRIVVGLKKGERIEKGLKRGLEEYKKYKNEMN